VHCYSTTPPIERRGPKKKDIEYWYSHVIGWKTMCWHVVGYVAVYVAVYVAGYVAVGAGFKAPSWRNICLYVYTLTLLN